VPYTVYEPTLPDNSHLLDPVDLADLQYDILRDVERTLKAEGIPVLSDFEKCCLWVFHIHGIAEAVAGGPEDAAVVDLTLDTVNTGQTKDERWLQLEERLQEEWGFTGELHMHPNFLCGLTVRLYRICNWHLSRFIPGAPIPKCSTERRIQRVF
jgi:hypothetical protein